MPAAYASARDASSPSARGAAAPAKLAVRCRRKPAGDRSTALELKGRRNVFTSLTYDQLPSLHLIHEISPATAAALTCCDLPPLNLSEEAPTMLVSATYDHLPRLDSKGSAEAWGRQLSLSSAGNLSSDASTGEADRTQEAREIAQTSPAAAAPHCEPPQDDQTQAPTWSDESSAGFGRFVHRKAALAPREAFQTIKTFFQDDSVPTDFQVGPTGWTLEGVSFKDFVAVGFSVSIFASAQGGSVIAFFRTGNSDVVLFAQLVEQVIGEISGQASGARPRLVQMDVEFDDFEDDEEEGDLLDWDARVRCLLKGAPEGGEALQQAWQTLALWGAHSAESRPHVARFFCSEDGIGLVAKALQGEKSNQTRALYPMAAALKFASLAASTAGIAAGGLLPMLRAADDLPGLVARELGEAVRNLQSGA